MELLKNKFKAQTNKDFNKGLSEFIWAKHEMLKLSKIISEDCHIALSSARDKRNDFVHDGAMPDYSVIENLWGKMHELFESVSGVGSIRMRQLVPLRTQDLGYPEKYSFDEWVALSKSL